LLKGVGDGSISMDCAVIPSKYPGIFTVQTTDFFYPLVDDPYMQGKIGCANVLSDLYSMGISECDSMLMLLAASSQMPQNERKIVTQQMVAGFNDLAKEAQTKITGGQSVLNPWPIIGGVATSVCKESDFIRPEHIVAGDVLVLTKPLGTQVAVNAHQWLSLKDPTWNEISSVISPEETIRAYELAMTSMARLNRVGAQLMQKYKAHGATDVTGFGILGHATNLVKNQTAAVHFEIHTLPILRGMRAVNEKVPFSLLQGFSSETSGGLLLGLPADKAQAFCDEIQQIEGFPAWIIGRALPSDQGRSHNSCRIVDNPTILEI